jgi:hypothetical protein
MFDLKRSCLLLIVALALASTLGCGSSFRSASEPVAASSVPEPNIRHDKGGAIPSLQARVTKLVFFGSGPSDIAPLRNPIYRSRFEHSATKTVHPEIHLTYPPADKRIYFTLTVHVRENGKTLRIVDYEGRIEPSWSSSHHSVGVGIMGPGNWQIGRYEADVHINGEKVATGFFEIF